MRHLLRKFLGRSHRSCPEHLRTGSRGERIAARHLKAEGYRVLARNLRNRTGELDLVCLDPDRRTIVVVEVKTRTLREGETRATYAPELAVNPAKQRKLVSATRELMRSRRWSGRRVRIDVVAVEIDQRGRAAVRHHMDAVRPS